MKQTYLGPGWLTKGVSFKVTHHIKFLFNGSVKPLLLVMISQLENKNLPIILYDFLKFFPTRQKMCFVCK
jgi:hypothetical protein